jgi:hypothetical protein
MTIRGRHPRYSGPEFEKLARSMAHYPAYGPPDPKWDKVIPNFEGVAMNEDPDAYDRERDRRRTG